MFFIEETVRKSKETDSKVVTKAWEGAEWTSLEDDPQYTGDDYKDIEYPLPAYLEAGVFTRRDRCGRDPGVVAAWLFMLMS